MKYIRTKGGSIVPMRLTYKKTVAGYSFYEIKPDIGEDAKAQKWNFHGALEKLGQLEDIEEELGIDLVTLFKALENGAYFRNPYYKNEITELHNLEPDLIFTQRCFDISMERFVSPNIYSGGGAFFFFKGYGKTWALTKEELE